MKKIVKVMLLLLGLGFIIFKLAVGTRGTVDSPAGPITLLACLISGGIVLGTVIFGIWYFFTVIRAGGKIIRSAVSFEITGVGLTLIVLGEWVLIRDIRAIISLFSGFSAVVREFGLWSITLLPILPVLFIAAGAGFLFLKNWGKILAQVSLTIDLLLRSFTIAGFWLNWLAMKGIINRAVVPANADVQGYILGPTYIVFVIEIALLFFVSRHRVKARLNMGE